MALAEHCSAMPTAGLVSTVYSCMRLIAVQVVCTSYCKSMGGKVWDGVFLELLGDCVLDVAVMCIH